MQIPLITYKDKQAVSNEHVSSHPVPFPILGWDGLHPWTLAHP